jgi:hypothetical protein
MTTVNVFNERQRADVNLSKSCEMPGNAAEDYNPYESLRFGLYAKEDILAPDGQVAVPANGLMEYVTVDANGHGAVKSDLPFGQLLSQRIGDGGGLCFRRN